MTRVVRHAAIGVASRWPRDDGGMGAAAGRTHERAVREHRDHEEPAGGMADGMTQHAARSAGDYHSVHLTEDPARAVVWRAVAESPVGGGSPPDARVLEIGAGYCCWINAVRAAGRVAVDTWPGFAASRRAGRRGDRARCGDRPAQRSAPDSSTSCSRRTCSSTSSRRPRPASSRDVAALLRPGGRF